MSDFSVLLKPASSLCNLRCRYCFYADESRRRTVASYGVMTERAARNVIEKAFRQAGGRGCVHFAFQGGEPTMAGLPFFERFTHTARTLCPPGVKPAYSIQTNGTLLDENWCALFRENGFLVGLSFDGYPAVHDYLRVDGNGRGTSREVLAAASLLRRAGVDFNILTVVTAQLAKHPKQVWEFYRRSGFSFIQLIPCLNPLEEPEAKQPFALTPGLYASFLTAFFRLWRDELYAGRYVSVRLFDNLVRMARGEPPEQCGLAGRCSLQFVVEADGGVYPCDFYVLDQTRAGNINDADFNELAASPSMRDFLNEGTPNPPPCENCGVGALCGGGCRRYRSFLFSESGRCPMREFLTASLGDLQRIAALVR